MSTWDGHERRINPCRRHDCAEACPVEGGVCKKHEDLIGMWKWLLLTIGGATLSVAGLIWGEATHIHENQDIIKSGLASIRETLAGVGTRVDINTERLDILEERERTEPHHGRSER